jgi:hypothetical protein
MSLKNLILTLYPLFRESDHFWNGSDHDHGRVICENGDENPLISCHDCEKWLSDFSSHRNRQYPY